MKAARFYGGKDIRLEILPDPVPEQGEVLVQVAATGICGSDLHGYHAENPKQLAPRTAGHELTGEIVAPRVGKCQTQGRGPCCHRADHPL